MNTAHRLRLVRSILDVAEIWNNYDAAPLLLAVLQARTLPALVRHNRRTPGFRGRILGMTTSMSRASKPGEIGRKIKRLAANPTEREILTAALSRTRFSTRSGRPGHRRASK